MQYEAMDGEQFRALMDKNASISDLAEMAKEKERRSHEENEAAAKEAEERERREAEEKARSEFSDPFSDFTGRNNDQK